MSLDEAESSNPSLKTVHARRAQGNQGGAAPATESFHVADAESKLLCFLPDSESLPTFEYFPSNLKSGGCGKAHFAKRSFCQTGLGLVGRPD